MKKHENQMSQAEKEAIAVEKPPYTYVSVGGSNRKRQHYVEGFNPNLHTEGMGGIPTSGEMERISGPYKTVKEAAIAAKAYSEQTGIPTDKYVEFHARRASLVRKSKSA